MQVPGIRMIQGTFYKYPTVFLIRNAGHRLTDYDLEMVSNIIIITEPGGVAVYRLWFFYCKGFLVWGLNYIVVIVLY